MPGRNIKDYLDEISKKLDNVENDQHSIARDVATIRVAQDQITAGLNEIANLKHIICQLHREICQLQMAVTMLTPMNQAQPMPVEMPHVNAMPGLQQTQAGHFQANGQHPQEY